MARPVLACAAALLSWSLAAPLFAQTAATPAAPTGNVEAGKRLYTEKRCFFCHGTEGQGGGSYPRIARVQRGADNFVRYVRQPAAMAALVPHRLTKVPITTRSPRAMKAQA